MGSKKVFLSFFSILFLVSVVLAGCSGSDSSSGNEGSGSEGDQVTLDIFQFKVEFKDQFEAVAEQYQEANPGVKINIQTVGGGEDYGAALRSKFASGDEPAIFNIGGPTDVIDWEDSLADLTDSAAAGAALEGTLDGVTKDDQVLGLPFNQEGYGLIYNTEIFEKAGINPADIKDMASLEAAVKTLDEKKSDLGLEAVFALPAKETWVTGLHLSNAFISPEFDGNVTSAFESKTVDFKYGDAMKNFIDLQNKHSVQPVVSLDYSQQVEELFSTGKVAMIQQGNWVYGSIAGIDEELANNKVGILPIPVPGYKEDAIPVGVPMYWAVNKNKDEKVIEEATKFLDWLYTSDEGKEVVLNDFKFVPAYEGYDASKITDPLSKQVYEYAEAGKTIGWVFMGYPANWGQNELGANIQKYLAEEATWEEIVEDSKAAWAESKE
ncbi:extracellular solute-binding protein [Metabacillus litoralis]|uniref:ABC transporter substrate-binding protein n=1 Tax=Metabacillus TaxID=2675233 RepID=UPI001B98EE5E|nr:extracellular solute-binding protein [Metabacillus litoralis]MCM3408490.1 extracellular solute-binding protein [Metabacillus litoralis]UHA59843.1 extracellular solute-binding protein [Metabacillus litoralis]